MSTLSKFSAERQVKIAEAKWRRWFCPTERPIEDFGFHPSVLDIKVGIGPGVPLSLGKGFSPAAMPARREHRGMLLTSVLTGSFSVHAHHVPYYDPTTEYLVRLNKDSAPDPQGSNSTFVRSHFPNLQAQVMFLDFDARRREPDGTVGKKLPWNAEVRAVFARAKAAWLASGECTWGWFNTKHGIRLAQPLEQPVTLDGYERIILQFYELMKPHIAALDDGKPGVFFQFDDCLKYWNAYSSCANILRSDGQTWRADEFEYRHMIALPLDRIPEPAPAPPKSATRTRSSSKQAPSPIADEPSTTDEDVETSRALARLFVKYSGITDTIYGHRHAFYRHLTGALLHAGAGQHLSIELVSMIARYSGHNEQHHKNSAERTAQRFMSGGTVTGLKSLRKQVCSKLPPQQRDELDGFLLEFFGRWRKHLADMTPTQDVEVPIDQLAATRDSLLVEMRNHSNGLGGVKIVACETGFGKTQLTHLLAHERAVAALEKQEEMRARAMANVNHHDHAFRTSYSAPTNALAEQYETKLRERGTDSTRRFGALSVESAESGMEPCQFRAKALPLVNGGQNITRTFCGTDEDAAANDAVDATKEKDPLEPEPVRCPFRDTCQVRHGIDANTPKGDLVHIVNHAMIRRRAAAASMHELVVIDEPPHYREAANITDCDRENFNSQNSFFQAWFIRQMRPFVHRVMTCKSESFQTVSELFRGFESESFELLYKQNGKRKRISSAPIEPGILQSFKKDITHIDPVKLGAASRVYNTILKMVMEYGALVAADFGEEKESDGDLLTLARKFPTRIRLSKLHGQGDVLQIVQINRDFAEPLMRSGPTIILDANANTNRAAYEKILGYELPDVKKITVADAMPIERTHLKTSMSRAKMFHYGRIDKEVLGTACRRVRVYIEQGPKTYLYGLIPYRTIALVILAAKGVDVKSQWKDNYGHLTSLIYIVREALGKTLDQIVIGDRKNGKWPSNWFGAIRGLDHMKDLDGIITIGDPWPNMDEVRADAELLGFDEEWVTKQLEMRARDELEQAHGRLRTVYRTKGGRSLHIGHVCPGGTGWSSKVDVRRIEITSGPVRRNSSMTPEELEAAIETTRTTLKLETRSEALARVAELGKRSIRTVYRWLAGEAPVSEEFAAFVGAHLENWGDEYISKLLGWDRLIA